VKHTPPAALGVVLRFFAVRLKKTDEFVRKSQRAQSLQRTISQCEMIQVSQAGGVRRVAGDYLTRTQEHFSR
jgi:hypothetical protein